MLAEWLFGLRLLPSQGPHRELAANQPRHAVRPLSELKTPAASPAPREA